MHYPRLPSSTILSPRPHARTRPHHLPIQLFRFLRLNEFDVLEGAGDGGDDKDGTYSPLSYRYEDPTQNISSIHMHKRSSCCQPRGKGQNVQLQRKRNVQPKRGCVCVCVYPLTDSLVVVAYTFAPISMHHIVFLSARKYPPYWN